MSAYLTPEQIAAFASSSKSRFRTDSVGSTDKCAYCGVDTKMLAYTDMNSKTSWPPCCSKSECLDKWEPLPEMKP